MEGYKQGLPLRDLKRPSQWSAWLPGSPLLPHGPLEAEKTRRGPGEVPGRFGYRPERKISPLSIIATGNCEMYGVLPLYSRFHPAPRSLGQWERMSHAPAFIGNCERDYSLFPNRVCNDFARAQVELESRLLEDLRFAIRNRELLRVEDVRTLRSQIYSYVPSAGYRYYNRRLVRLKNYRETGVLGHLVRLFLRGKKRKLSIRDKLLVGMDELATPLAVAKQGRHQVTWCRPCVY